MSEISDYLDKVKKAQKNLHAKRIEIVKRNEVPQHILATKEIANELCDDGDGYATTETGFYFREKLVNRLMYLSYLHGKDEIDKASFKKGYKHAIEKFETILKEMVENPIEKEECLCSRNLLKNFDIKSQRRHSFK